MACAVARATRKHSTGRSFLPPAPKICSAAAMSMGWREPTMLIKFAFICVMSSRTGAVMASMLASSCTSDGICCAPGAAGRRSRSDSDAEAEVPGGTKMALARRPAPLACAAAASARPLSPAPRPRRRKWSGVPRSAALAGLLLLLLAMLLQPRRAAPLQDATRSHGGGALGRRHVMAAACPSDSTQRRRDGSGRWWCRPKNADQEDAGRPRKFVVLRG
jgi:hypothetical protein